MASADVRLVSRGDWVLANPWLWIAIALGASGSACVWAALVPDGGLHLLLILLGLLSAALAVTLRVRSARPALLDAMPSNVRRFSLWALLLVYAVLALGLTGFLGAAILNGKVFYW